MHAITRLYYEGVEAAQDLVRHVFRVDVSKTLDPVNPRDFLVISQRLGDALHKVSRAGEAEALKNALDALDVDWKKLDVAGQDAVIAAAKKHLTAAGSQVAPKAVQLYEASAQKVISGTKQAVSTKFGIGHAVSFTQLDGTVAHHAAMSQALYIRNEFGRREDRFSAKARQIVSEGVENGFDRYVIGAQLKDELGDVVKRSDAYWQMAAGVFVNRSRTYGALSSYQSGGFQRFVFRAVLDEVTTLQCRFMNGRSFSVPTALTKFTEAAENEDPEDVRFTMPWLAVGRDPSGAEFLYHKTADGGRERVADVHVNAVGQKDEVGSFHPKLADSELSARGVVTPPLHANCRSWVDPDFDSVGALDDEPDEAPRMPNRALEPRVQEPPRWPLQVHGPTPNPSQIPNVMLSPRLGGIGSELSDDLLAAGEGYSTQQAATALTRAEAAAQAEAEAAAALAAAQEAEAAAAKIAALQAAADAAAKVAEEALLEAQLAAFQAKNAAIQALAEKSQAAQKLVDALPNVGKKKNFKQSPIPLPPAHPHAPNAGPFVPFNDPPPMSLKYAKIQNATVTVPLDQLIGTESTVSAQKIKTQLSLTENNTGLNALLNKPTVVKFEGKYYIVDGHENVIARKLLGADEVEAYVVDYDKKVPQGLKSIGAKKPEPLAPAPSLVPHPTPVAAPAPAPAPMPVTMPVAAKPLPPPSTARGDLGDADNILAKKTGDAKGSNEGGFYTGADGVKRYVKFYKDDAQGLGEHLANQLYSDLGLGAPKSTLFRKDGKLFYASDIIDDTVTLGSKTLTKGLATEALDGFAADVLTGNWDAAGMSLDNMMVDSAGNVFRIDNGGTFLMRAQAGRKPEALLDAISEWDVFFSGKNPAYAKLAKAAGIDSADDEAFKSLLTGQLKRVLDLHSRYGSWDAYVKARLPAGEGMAVQNRMVQMLEARTKLLREKYEELIAPPKPKPPPKVWAPGEKKTLSLFSEKNGGFHEDAVSKHGTVRRKDEAYAKMDKLVRNNPGSAYFDKLFADTGVPAKHAQTLRSNIDAWTGGYKDSSMQGQYYKAAEKLMNGKGSGGTYHDAVAAAQTGRGKRISEFLKKAGVPDVPDEVSHVDVMRGCDGSDFIRDVAKAWADPKATHANFRCYEVASWGRSYDNSVGFAKGHGVIARWRDCPLPNVLADQLADDSSFITSFAGEKEVIAGLGHRKGIPLPVEDYEVHYKGARYRYEDRQKLLEVLAQDGFKL